MVFLYRILLRADPGSITFHLSDPKTMDIDFEFYVSGGVVVLCGRRAVPLPPAVVLPVPQQRGASASYPCGEVSQGGAGGGGRGVPVPLPGQPRQGVVRIHHARPGQDRGSERGRLSSGVLQLLGRLGEGSQSEYNKLTGVVVF